MSNWLKHILIFIGLLLIQVAVFDTFDNWWSSPMPFITAVFMLPLDMKYPWLILIAFGYGFAIDALGDGNVDGLHSFILVLLVSVRKYLIPYISNITLTKENEALFLDDQPFQWYALYIGPLIFLHQLIYYLIETIGNFHILDFVLKVVVGTVLSFAIALPIVLLLYKRKKSR